MTEKKDIKIIHRDASDPFHFHQRSEIIEGNENIWFNAFAIDAACRGSHRRIYVLIIICLILIVLETVGARLSFSVAILTDLAHLVSDLAGFLFALFAISMTRKETSLKHLFGFVRAEVLGVLCGLVLMFGLTAWILFEAILRLVNKQYLHLNPLYMLLTAIGALLVNLLMAYLLHDSLSIHINSKNNQGIRTNNKSSDFINNIEKDEESIAFLGHRDTPIINPVVLLEESQPKPKIKNFAPKIKSQFENQILSKEKYKKQNQDNLKLKTTWVHLAGDIIKSTTLILVSLFIYLTNDFKFIDPLASIFLSLITFYFIIPAIKDIFHFLMDSTPQNVDMKELAESITNLDFVDKLESLELWLLAFGKPILTTKIICYENPELVLKNVKELARKRGILYTTLQIETHEKQNK